MPIRAISFDLFDTLVDLESESVPLRDYGERRLPVSIFSVHAAIREYADIEFDVFLKTMAQMDREFRESHYAEGIELPSQLRFETLIRRLGMDVANLAEELVDLHMRGIRDCVRNLDHHASVLERLRARVPIALCSNFSHTPTALAVLREAALIDHLDIVVISEAIGIRKPRREIFDAVTTALEVAPEEVLHVGDKLAADVAGAAACGMKSAWITRRIRDPRGERDSYEGPDPDHQIEDLEELPELLEELGVAR